jgi:hypothetical protein
MAKGDAFSGGHFPILLIVSMERTKKRQPHMKINPQASMIGLDSGVWNRS